MTRIVILGGGFAGISVARELGRSMRGDPSNEVHLVNNENYFVFQPLLPEVVACSIEPGHVVVPIRQLCPHAQFHYGSVVGVDRTNKVVTIVGRDERRPRHLAYDHLVWGLGSVMNLSRVPGMAEHAVPIKTLGDALQLRNEVLLRLEEADQEPDDRRREQLLSFVTVGGGFSGVETMAAVNDLVRGASRFYHRVSRTPIRTILVHAGDRILPELSGPAATFAQRQLSRRGVELLLGRSVSEATAEGVILSDGMKIPAATVICTAGNAPHPLVAASGLPLRSGRLVVDACLRVQGTSDCWAVGDGAAVPDALGSGLCPTTAQFATRQGRLCARNIRAGLRQRSLTPFAFKGHGQLTMVGRRAGAGKVFGISIAGLFAWCLWRSVYLSKIPGVRAKLRVAIDWLMESLFPHDITMINVAQTDRLQRGHFAAGEVILRQGEIADRFYIIEAGEVEILKEERDGGSTRLGVRQAGSSFGEIALLNGVPRTATVKALTPVDVIMLSRHDFLSLTRSHRLIRTVIERQAKEIVHDEHTDEQIPAPTG